MIGLLQSATSIMSQGSLVSVSLFQWLTILIMSLLICMLAFVFVKALRHHSPSTKHVVIATAMAAHLLLFVGFISLPKIQFNVIPENWFETTSLPAVAIRADGSGGDLSPTDSSLPSESLELEQETSLNSSDDLLADRWQGPLDRDSSLMLQDEVSGSSVEVDLEKSQSSLATTSRKASSISLSRILTFIWLGGFLLSLSWLAWAHLSAYLIVKRLPLLEWFDQSNKLEGMLAAITKLLGFRQMPKIRVWNDTRIPMPVGIFQPTVVVPKAFFDWSETKQKHVLIHELTHITRRDSVHDLNAWLAAAIFWFNPCIWILKRQQGRQRELACDQTVVSISKVPEDYAADLVAVVREASGFAPSSAIAMARSSELKQRIENIVRFDPQILKRRRTIPWLLCGLLICGAGLGSLFAFSQVISTQEDSKPKVELIKSDDFVAGLSPELLKSYEKTQSDLLAKHGERQTAAISIKGRVLDADGKPVSGSTVYLREDPIHRRQETTAFNVLLMKEFAKRTQSFVFAKTKTVADGSFSFENVETPAFLEKTPYMAEGSLRWAIYATSPEEASSLSLAWHKIKDLESAEPVELKFESSGLISGKASDANGEPIAGALVSVTQFSKDHGYSTEDYHALSNEERIKINMGFFNLGNSKLSPRATTDAKGNFLIAGLPLNYRARMKIEHPDSISKQTDSHSIVQPGEKPSLFELDSGWRFSLTTKDEAGARVPNAHLQLIGEFNQGVGIEGMPYLSFQTDEEGRFTSPPLPKCGVTISLDKTKNQAMGVTSRPLRIAVGESGKTKAVELELTSPRSIHGQVVSVDESNPLGELNADELIATYYVLKDDMFSNLESYFAKVERDGSFKLQVPDGLVGQVSISRANGTFRFDLPTPGENAGYTGRISQMLKRREQLKKISPRQIRGDEDPLELMPSRRDIQPDEIYPSDSPLVLPVARSMSVSGIMIDEDGTPVAGAKLEMLYKDKVNYGRSLSVLFPSETVADAKGRFEIVGVQRRFKPVYRATHPTKDLTTDFEWSAFTKEADGELRLQFSQGPAVRAIVTLDGNPLADQEVVLLAPRGGQMYGPFAKLKTDENGICVFKNVPRSSNMHLHVDRSEDDKFRKDFSTLGDQNEFTISDMNFVSEGSGIVAGRIVDPDGKPVKNAEVWIAEFGGDLYSSGQFFEEVKSNEDGYFKSAKVPPDTKLILRIGPELSKEARYPRQPMRVSAIANTGDEELRIIVDPRLSMELPWRTSK